MSKSSRTSLRGYGKYGTRKKKEAYTSLLKPYNFCCDINDRDDETRYDKRKPPFTSSLMVLSPDQESPILKFRFQSIETAVNGKRKGLKNKSNPTDWDLDGNPCVKTRGPLQWFQEDEIEIAKDQFWSERQKTYNEEADRSTAIGERKVKTKMTPLESAGPRWYQDLSIPQVLSLGETMTADYEETITVRTQKALAVIGVTSTFVKIAPQLIKKLQHSTRLQPVEFLREIYRRVTGQYFEEEEYKKSYDCNERIILSAIAFLGLPDAVMELHNRLPQISKPVFPPKPKPPQTPSIRHGLCKWPYEEPLPQPPDWVTYRKSLDKWREKCKLVPRPRIILPQLKGYRMNHSRNFGEKRAETPDKGTVAQNKLDFSGSEDLKTEKQSETKINQNEDNSEKVEASFDLSIPTLPGGDKQTFDFTISGLGEKSGPVNYKICGSLKPPFERRKSWLGEKEAHYIVSGISEHEDPPQCPVTYVMTGISYVTPDNSDEQFLAELKLGDGSKRVYPAGRKNLSKKWQEWLQDTDEEFLEVEREANKLIKSVEATMRLVIPGNRCDACCSCRQTRKTNLKEHATKSPHMVIDSIAEGDNRQRYIVGSLAMHSPAPSPVESTVNLLEVIASKETVEKKLVINGITDDSGETTYYISGVTEEIQYSPKTTLLKEHPPKPLRNVPPCACTIEQIFNEGKTATTSGDDIPQTKKKGICYGRKYRPKESPPFTCKEYPDDKSCRRNPFDNKLKRVGKFPKPDAEDDDQPKEKRMFTMPAFEPCGDEDGMAVCGGPWGAKNVPSPEVVAAREAEAKRILRAPPCGSTPGRAVCGGPWGATNPKIKVRKAGEDEDEEEEESEGEEDDEGEKKLSPRELEKIAKEAEAEKIRLRRQQLKRDKLCSERFDDGVTDADQSAAEGPPAYCDYDNLWDKMRTAPTVNPWDNEYEKSLGLTQPVLCSDKHKIIHKVEGSSKRKKKDSGSSGEGKNRSVNEIKSRDEQNSKTAKDNVRVLYSGRQTGRAPLHLSDTDVVTSQQSDAKARKLMKGSVKKSSFTSDKKLKNSEQKTPGVHRTLEPKNTEVKNKDKKFENAKKPDKKAKSVHIANKGNGRQYKQLSLKNDCGNNRVEKRSEKEARLRKSPPRHKSPNSQNSARQKGTKSRSASPATEDKPLKEYKVTPAVIPDTPRLPCQRENAHSANESDDCDCCADAERTGIDHRKEGPFGWRTKSQQELPREKTLAYLAEPNDPVEMVKVREGGRPCNCRENRNNKKILLYNIGGAVEVSKAKRGSQRPQLIEGVIYVTPPQSPRDSSEYIPEYDLYDSPHKMCVRKRSDKELKHINELSTIRSLSPRKETNVESCPCGYEPEESNRNNSSSKATDEPPKATDEPPKARASGGKGNRWSSALKDEGLIDYFVSCQDAVPCWLRCAKFSKAGCCEKPKLLQVKKPVCECKYERRVVKREEGKQKWVARQQRLKTAKKQPYLQVAGTSRPMTQDTKLIISSVKKVLRDGEFIPETQYCVSGIAENYAMGPPQQVIPGITMQSPLVTPEPSKPDILCMCGHRHWSPTDITGSPTSKPGKDYPCRGREQNKEITEIIPTNNGEMLSAENSEPYVAYRSCAESSRACNAGFEGKKQLVDKKKRKLISSDGNSGNNTNRKMKKLKFHGEKESQNFNGTGNIQTTQAAARIAIGEPKGAGKQSQNSAHETTIATGNNTSKNQRDNSEQNPSSDNEATDLSELMKIELEKMASEDFILAKLPECWLIPQLQSWIEYREGKVYTDAMKKELCQLSQKRWEMMQQHKKSVIPLPSLNLTQAEVNTMTFDRAAEMKEKIPVLQAKYYSEQRKRRVSEARSYWPTMEFGKFPSLSFKEAYFTYMAGKEADGHVFRPWNIEES